MIEKYLNELKAQGRTPGTIKTYSKVLHRLNDYKLLNEVTKQDLIGYFNKFDCTDSTRMLHSIVLKKYYSDIGTPEISSWLKPKKPHETLKSDDILTGADVNKMIEATDSPYWKALLSVLFESGARIGEIQLLKYKDFQETKEGLIVHIPTVKTGAGYRKMILINSTNYIHNLQSATGKKPDDVVFYMAYRWMWEVLKDLGMRAGLNKPVHPHSFRHARATEEAIKGTPEGIIRKMHGWSNSSTMVNRYVHLSDTAVIDSQLGHLNSKKPVELNPVEKFDITPVYAKLTNENAALKARLDDMDAKMRAFFKANSVPE